MYLGKVYFLKRIYFCFVPFCLGRNGAGWNTNKLFFRVGPLTLLQLGTPGSHLLSAPSPLAAAASLGSPGFAALGLDLFCTLQREQLQKGSLKWEAGDSGGVGGKENLIVFDISGKLWADHGVRGRVWDPPCQGDFCSLP